MAVQLNAKKIEDMARENSDDIVKPRNPFDLGPLLVNGDHDFASMTFVQENVAKAGDSGLTTLEQEEENKNKRDDITSRGYAAIRFFRDIQDKLREENLEASHSDRRRIQKDSSQKLSHDNDENDIIVTAKKHVNNAPTKSKSANNKSFTHAAEGGVYNTLTNTVDYVRDTAGDGVEAVAGKDVRQLGGSVMRATTSTLTGDFTKASREVDAAVNKAGNVVENVAGKDARSFGGHVLRGEFSAAASQVGNGISNTTANAVSSIRKIDLNPFW